MKVVSLSFTHTMTLLRKGSLGQLGSAGFSILACVLTPSESVLFPQKSSWKRFWAGMDEPIVDSKIVGGCDKDPVGIRSGIRERGSVHAWPVISQASQIKLQGNNLNGVLGFHKVGRPKSWAFSREAGHKSEFRRGV